MTVGNDPRLMEDDGNAGLKARIDKYEAELDSVASMEEKQRWVDVINVDILCYFVPLSSILAAESNSVSYLAIPAFQENFDWVAEGKSWELRKPLWS